MIKPCNGILHNNENKLQLWATAWMNFNNNFEGKGKVNQRRKYLAYFYYMKYKNMKIKQCTLQGYVNT